MITAAIIILVIVLAVAAIMVYEATRPSIDRVQSYYEYTTAIIDPGDTKRLNEFGRHGWSLIYYESDNQSRQWTCVFAREIYVSPYDETIC
jgi:hypothetical protein